MEPPANPSVIAADLQNYAQQYDQTYDAPVAALVESVKKRGYLTKSDLTILGDWKSPRIRPKLAQNSDDFIQEVTRQALSTPSVRLAVHIPQVLVGVGMPVASTILHWFHPDPFPILDVRALWTLGLQDEVQSLDLWEKYVCLTRRLAQDWNTDMRTLDRALWQYSAKPQVPTAVKQEKQ